VPKNTDKNRIPKLMSLTQFADFVGVSRNKVYAAAANGKFTYKQAGRKRVVDAIKAKAEWEENKNPTEARKNPGGLKTKNSAQSEGPKKYMGMTLADAERQEKYYRAELQKQKFLEQSGKLIEADKVRKTAFELARKTRDAVMSVPSRTAHELAALTDPHKLEIRLSDELAKALEAITKEASK